jgi:hypothetical protein
MKFIYPEFLYAFAVLLVPILLHLFHLRRFKTFYFSNVSFLKKIETTSKSTRKVRNFILLLTRILAFSAFVLAFAQPYFSDDDKTLKNNDEINVFFIDNSLSMSATGAEGELLSQAKNMARELILNEKQGSLFLIVSNHFSTKEQHLFTQSDAIDYIDQLNFFAYTKQVNLIWPFINHILEENNKTGNITVFTDGQKTQWTPSKQVEFKHPVKIVQITPSNTNNISIDSIWMDTPIQKHQAPLDVNIKITNHSNTEIKSTPVEVSLNDNKQLFTAVFDENKQTILKVNFQTPTFGHHRIQAEIQDEQMYFDDLLLGTFEVKSKIDIGIISGENATNNINIVYSLDPYFNPTTWNIHQIELDALATKELLIINQPVTIEPSLAQTLLDLFKQGKSIVFIPNPNSDIDSWNYILNQLELPLLAKEETVKTSLQHVHTENSFFNGIFTQKKPTVQIPINRSTRLITSNSNQTPLISYSDNTPFLVKSNSPETQVYLFNADLHSSNQNFITSDLFSAIFLRFGELANTNNPLYHTIGTPSTHTITFNSNNETPLVIKKDNLQFIPKQSSNSKHVFLNLFNTKEEQTIESGIYSVIIPNQQSTPIAFNYERNESNLEYNSINQITEDLQSSGIEHVSGNQLSETNQIHTLYSDYSSHLWRILLILAIACLFAEMLIVKFWID